MTPTLKTGISMNKRYRQLKTGPVSPGPAMPGAFTFVEVIVALAIASISLIGLIRLHIISVNMNNTAETMTQAAFLAQEKIAGIAAAGYPERSTDSGTIQRNNITFQWQTQIADASQTLLENAGIDKLREVSVDVGWKQGLGTRHLQMSTLLADRKLK